MTSRPLSRCVKNLEASIDMNIGDKLKKAVLVPVAMPVKPGKFLEAANIEENHLCNNK